MPDKKLFTCVIQSVWNYGDMNGDNSWVLGIFDNPETAYNTGLDFLRRNFHYDENDKVFFGDAYADEVWVDIFAYELNQELKIDVNAKCEKRDGKWYVGEEVVYG